MKWFENLGTARKLAVCFGILVTLLVGVGVTGLNAASASNDALERNYLDDMPSIDKARRTEILRLEVAKTFRDYLMTNDPAERQARMRGLDELDQERKAVLDELQEEMDTPETRAHFLEVKKTFDEFMWAAREGARATSDGNLDEKQNARKKMLTLGTHIGDELNAICTITSTSAKTAYEKSQARYARSRVLISCAILFAVVVGGIFARATVRAIANPLASAVDVLRRVAQGDLTAKLDLERRDEIGALARALDESLASLRNTLSRVNDVSQEVSSAASELATSADQISGGAQQQAASLEETAASLEEISSTVKQNADNAQQAARLASGARDAAEQGGKVVDSAVAAMNEITSSSKRIADITSTIDEIAFQTNLLALNAAVEAARAGEHGRGFGVVAAEVRTLAQRAGLAAKEIRALIADAAAKVEVGTAQVNQSGETLTEIVRSVKRVTDMVSEIAAASREQNAGVDQVNIAVTQVDQVTQSNAAQTEELSATASAMSDKSAHLRNLVSGFVLGASEPTNVRPLPTKEPAKVVPRQKLDAARRRKASAAAAGSGVVRASAEPPRPLAANSFEEF